MSDACGNAGHLVKDNELGVLVPVGDLKTMNPTLKSLAWDGEVRATLTSNAVYRFKKWSTEGNVDAIITTFSDVAQGGWL